LKGLATFGLSLRDKGFALGVAGPDEVPTVVPSGSKKVPARVPSNSPRSVNFCTDLQRNARGAADTGRPNGRPRGTLREMAQRRTEAEGTGLEVRNRLPGTTFPSSTFPWYRNACRQTSNVVPSPTGWRAWGEDRVLPTFTKFATVRRFG